MHELENSEDENQTSINEPNVTRRVISISNVTQNSNIKKKLKCLNTNAQSLQYKKNELEKLINEYNVQIAAVTETWGKQWKEVTLEIKDFNIYRKDRVGRRQGGGCLIYVNKDLKSYACRELENLPGEDSVWCWVKLTNETKILVGCIYRSTSSEDANNELLMNQMRRASEIAGKNRILILGDFNVKEINWEENEIE